MPSGIPFGDMTGPLFAVIGTLAALHQRERTGVGQFVDVSLLGTLASVVATEPFDKLQGLGIPTRTGNRCPGWHRLGSSGPPTGTSRCARRSTR